MKVLDLFSGIGGFSLGLERAGFETIAFCEIEEYPRNILKKHWPDVPIFEDVRKLDGKQFRGSVELICGGFPCQPFSVAGKQKGQKDDRHLWPEMLRLIREVQPTWVIGENVAGFVRMALDDVLLDLENEGYTSQSFIIPAGAVGGIHRRDRVWIVAYSEHNGLHAATESGGKGEAVLNCAEGENKTEQSQGVCAASDVANSINPGLEGYPGHEQNQRERQDKSRSAGSPRFSRNWQPIGIPVESPICHRDDGVPDRVARLKALGNAVVPQIPEMIGRAIMESYE